MDITISLDKISIASLSNAGEKYLNEIKEITIALSKILHAEKVSLSMCKLLYLVIMSNLIRMTIIKLILFTKRLRFALYLTANAG